MVQFVKGVLKHPDVEKEMEGRDRLFGIMGSLVKLVAGNHINSLIIYGGPGEAKRYVTKKTLADEGVRENSGWFMIKGKVTAAELYRNLFMHRNGHILVFDDSDSVWKNQDAVSLLRSALDSYDERLVSWYSSRTQNISMMSPSEKKEYCKQVDQDIKDSPHTGKAVKFPSEFIFDGRIIFITNLSADKLDSGVLDRSAKIDMTLTSL